MKNPKSELEITVPARYRDFMHSQNTCPLCNSQLTIRVESCLNNYNLREEASCPKCQILARVKDHNMH